MPPVRMRGPQGQTVEVAEDEIDFYSGRGFVPLAFDQEFREAEAAAARPDDRGVLGSVSALATSALSGATLGLSDVAIGSIATPRIRERLNQDRATNPTLSAIGEAAGGIAASLAAPGSALASTPAGVLARTANTATETLRATTSGAKALAGQVAVTGAEAAAQNVGSYLGSVALGDRKLTAEGVGGALGTGFVFGGAGGAAALGIEKGTIAARRLFSSVMDGGTDAASRAAGEWERRSKDLFDGNRANIDEARRRVDEAVRARAAAQLDQQRAGAYLDEERLLAARAGDVPPVAAVADDAIPTPAGVPSGPDPVRLGALADEAAAAEQALRDRIAGMEARIRAGEVPGEAGPFTPEGGRLAALREIGREDARAAVGGFDFAPRTGGALSEVKKGGINARPAPLDDLAEAKPAPATHTIDTPATEPAFGADDYDPFAVRPPPLKKKAAPAEQPPPIAPGPRPEPLSSDEFLSYKDAYRAASSPEHYGAGMMYSGGDYAAINAALRNESQLEGDVARAVTGLDDALELPQSRLQRDTTLYRGLSGPDAKKRFADVKPGDVLEDKAFLSTAANADSKVRNENIVFNIRAPAGTKGAPIPSKYSNEQEILLPRGTKLRVDGVEMVPQVPTEYRHKDAVDFEILPDKSVRVTSEYYSQVSKRTNRFTQTFPPIREINVSIVADDALAPLAAATDDPLMRALMGTKQGLDEGASIAQLGAAAQARPLSPRQLMDQHDALMDQAARASDAATKQALLREASAIEAQLAPPAQRALSDLDAFTLDAARYERAVAELAEELGQGAHPVTREAADALRKAEAEAERQAFDRAAQSIDDHADGTVGKIADESVKETTNQAGVDAYGPQPLSPKERVRYAKERKLEATAATSRARVAEAEARDSLKTAQARGREIGRAADTVGLGPAGKAAKPGKATGPGPASRAADLGAALEVASMLGIPVPSASDIPVIGPVASLYFKYRALKGGAERLMGRVPATGNARAAALAATTKDKAARAVDHMLGLVERKSPAIRQVAAVAGARLADAISDRLYDDGSKAPPKDAGLQDHAAARAREIGALAANPALIAQQVRREMRDVSDPDLVNAAVEFRTKQIGYLDSVRPKEPPPSPFRREMWKPDKAAATDFARRYAVAMDPLVALEQVEQRCLTTEAAEAYRAVYPLLFKQTQQRLMEQATKLQTALPGPQVTRMSILFNLPLDEALEGAALARTQATFLPAAEPPPDAGGAPPGPPVASIAVPTDLASAFQTASDRRAAAR